MKKIYILYNSDTNEVVATSEDRSLLEEICSDHFIEDVEYEWYWRTASPYAKVYDKSELYQVAENVWNDTLEWYDIYMLIFESEVI